MSMLIVSEMGLPLYARREPTSDLVVVREPKRDVQLYRDKACNRPFARFLWHVDTLPQRHDEFIVINKLRWRLIWLEDV